MTEVKIERTLYDTTVSTWSYGFHTKEYHCVLKRVNMPPSYHSCILPIMIAEIE